MKIFGIFLLLIGMLAMTVQAYSQLDFIYNECTGIARAIIYQDGELVIDQSKPLRHPAVWFFGKKGHVAKITSDLHKYTWYYPGDYLSMQDFSSREKRGCRWIMKKRIWP